MVINYPNINTFFYTKAKNTRYLQELNKRCKNEGVKSLLIMVDVVLDTIKQLEAQLVMRRYEGFIK